MPNSPSPFPSFLPDCARKRLRSRYGCLKALRLLSEKQPAVLYPEFDRFVALLGSENTILKWGGIIIIGNLAAVDSEHKIGRILDRYLAPISGSVMITAANTIAGAGKIARAKPQFANRIVSALLRVEEANYQTPECRNVALGHVVNSLDLFFEHIVELAPVIAFVQRQLGNTRNAVKKKAAAFLKRHGTPQTIRRPATAARASVSEVKASLSLGAADSAPSRRHPVRTA